MAIEYDFLPLNADELPVSKVFTFDNNSYIFLFRKNEKFDRIYLEIIDIETEETLYTTRLVYAGDVIHAVVEDLEIENILRPFDIADLLSNNVGETTVESGNLDVVKVYDIT